MKLRATLAVLLNTGNPAAAGSMVAASIGPSSSQQHTLPVVASDTIVLLDAAQNLSGKTLSSPTLSGTVAGTYTIGGTPTLGATLALNGQTLSGTATFSGANTFSATQAFTNASPFSVANAQTLTFAVAAQTVGGATLTLPDFAGVSDTVAFVTLAQTLTAKTLSGPTLSGTVAGTPTWASGQTFPSVTTATVTRAGANLTLSTTTSGDILLSPATGVTITAGNVNANIDITAGASGFIRLGTATLTTTTDNTADFGLSASNRFRTAFFGTSVVVAGTTTLGAGSLSTSSGDLSLNPAGSVSIIDKNIILGTTTGTQIGTLGTQKLGFYGAAPVVQAAASADLTDNSGGAADDTIALITNANNAGSADVVPTQNAIADLAAKVNKALTVLRSLGLMAT